MKDNQITNKRNREIPGETESKRERERDRQGEIERVRESERETGKTERDTEIWGVTVIQRGRVK